MNIVSFSEVGDIFLNYIKLRMYTLLTYGVLKCRFFEIILRIWEITHYKIVMLLKNSVCIVTCFISFSKSE